MLSIQPMPSNRSTSMSTTTNTNTTTATGPAQVDVRGPRFAAWVTTAVLLAVLVVSAFSTVAAAILLAVQAVVFAIGALRGPAPASVRPDLRHVRGAAAEPGHRTGTGAAVEVCPVGRVSSSPSSGVAGFALGVPLLGVIATAFALVRRVPQRGLRHLPGLPALPAGAPAAPHLPHKPASTSVIERNSVMARSDVLVSADWAESNLDAPQRRLRRGRRGRQRLRHRPHPRCGQAGLEDRSPGSGQARFR